MRYVAIVFRSYGKFEHKDHSKPVEKNYILAGAAKPGAASSFWGFFLSARAESEGRPGRVEGLPHDLMDRPDSVHA